MAETGLWIAWGVPTRGRERKALDLLIETQEYLGGLQAQSRIERFARVVLKPQSIELGGFILIQGSVDQIDALRRDGVTVVLTTHQLAEAEELADRILIIDHGTAVATGTPTELTRNGAENQLRFRAPRKLDLSLLVTALPESYRAVEAAPGEYLVEGRIDPQVLATVTAWCARLDVLATDMRVEQRSLEDVFLDLTGRELRS